MKSINVTFEDSEMEEIMRVKKTESQSWREFILQLARERLTLDSDDVTVFTGNVEIQGNLTIRNNMEVD